MPKTALGPKARLKLLETVFKKHVPVSEACRKFGISRFTFYKWAKRYHSGKSRNVNLALLKDKDSTPGTLPKSVSLKIEAVVKQIAIKNPNLSKYAITSKAKELLGGRSPGVHGVYNILKRHNLNTCELRRNYQSLVLQSRGKVLTPKERFDMLEVAESAHISVSQVCRDFGISRFTYYKWKKRFDKSGQSVDALVDRKSYFDNSDKKIRPEVEKSILSITAEFPNLSKYNLAQKVYEKLGIKVGAHGIYNVLKRNSLNFPEARFAYAQSLAPVSAPTTDTWIDRVQSVFEQFVPSLAPAPPPSGLVALWAGSLKFFKVFTLSSVISLATIHSGLWWINFISSITAAHALGIVFASIALICGTFFLLYSMKYYITLAVVLSFSQGEATYNRGQTTKGKILGWILGNLANAGLRPTRTSGPVGLTPDLSHITLEKYPFISVHIPFYNEKKVVERSIQAAVNFDYKGDYEVILCDDSTDETTQIIANYLKSQAPNIKSQTGDDWKLTQGEVRPGVVVKHIHRSSRAGFKGGALELARKLTDPRAEFVSVFDADFVPYPDTLTLFLKYFLASSGTLDFKKVTGGNKNTNHQSLITNHNPIAAVQGYQWHVLNKSENWITRGVRSEYSGSYVIERSGTELYGGLKQISGSVYMIRKDVLEEVGWGTSITEDFQLTLKLYEKGYKVVYTPYIQAPAECVSTIKRLVRQRMRWAEGHSFNIRRMFLPLLRSKNLTTPEKLE